MSAPDRIWAMPSDDGWMAPYCGNAPHDGSTEYVRADLYDPTQDERVQALAEAARALMHEAHRNMTGGKGHLIDDLAAALRALEQGEGKP